MPTVTLAKALSEIERGKPASLYLLHGDEYLAREGAKALVERLVPEDKRAMNVEALTEELAQQGLLPRLLTLPLFGGTKVVIVYDVRAFVSKQMSGDFGRKSREAWESGDLPKASRLFLQLLAAAGEDRALLEGAAQGELPAAARQRLLPGEDDPDTDRWLQEVAARALAEGSEIPRAPGGSQVYEEVVAHGVPPASHLILTAEAVDERRALVKRIRESGSVIDVSVRSKGGWDTQMRPEAARAQAREAAQQAGKTLEEAALARILEQTGFSVRALASELEKLFLYVGSRRSVTAEDVEAVFSASRETNIVNLTSALGERDAARALRAFRSLLAQREPVQRILPALAGELRSLVAARLALDARLEGRWDDSLGYPAFQGRLLPKLGAAGPEPEAAARLAAMHPFRAFNLLRSAARFPLRSLLDGLVAIQEADLALKTSGPPEALLVEALLLRLCTVS